jgi:hypothetical protein
MVYTIKVMKNYDHVWLLMKNWRTIDSSVGRSPAEITDKGTAAMLIQIPEGCKSYALRLTAERAIVSAKLPDDLAVMIHAQSVPVKNPTTYDQFELRFFPVLLPTEAQIHYCIDMIHHGVGFHVFRR